MRAVPYCVSGRDDNAEWRKAARKNAEDCFSQPSALLYGFAAVRSAVVPRVDGSGRMRRNGLREAA